MSVIQSFVWHRWNDQKKCYLVSTIERESSAPAAHGMRYNETIVWEYDWDQRTRMEKILLMAEDAPGSIKNHFFICQQITDGNYAWLFTEPASKCCSESDRRPVSDLKSASLPSDSSTEHS